jgi:predicted transcriptional regulator
MTRTLLTIDGAETIANATEFLGRTPVHALLVQESGWVVGAFGQKEALAARFLPPGTRVGQVMSQRVISIPPHLPMHLAAGQAAELGARLLAVVSDGETIGVLTPADFTRACASALYRECV